MTQPSDSPEQTPPPLQLAGQLGIDAATLAAAEASNRVRRKAEYLARLLADHDLLLEIQLNSFEGAAWDKLALALAEYGWPIMGGWIYTGEVLRQCRLKHLKGAPEGTLGLWPKEAEELAGLIVAEAIPSFRDTVLRTGRWDYRKGASLSTFFVGHCCIVFINVYRRWRAEEGTRDKDRRREDNYEQDRSQRSAFGAPAEQLVVEQLSAEVLAATVRDPTTRTIVQLKALGHSSIEIAEQLDLTVGAVDMRVHRLRQQLLKEAG